MRFERLQIVLFRSSSSSFFLLRGSLPLLARSLDSKFLAKSVRTRTQVFIHVSCLITLELEFLKLDLLLNSSFKNSRY